MHVIHHLVSFKALSDLQVLVLADKIADRQSDARGSVINGFPPSEAAELCLRAEDVSETVYDATDDF